MSEVRESLSEAWKKWSKGFLDLPTEPMSRGLSGVFIQCSMAESQNLPAIPEVAKTFQYQVIEKRSEAVGLKMTDALKMLLSAIVASPGEAVMYVYALLYIQQVEKLSKVDIDAFSIAFPMGFPPESELHKAWDAQKIKGRNMLDMLTADELKV